MLVKKQQFPLIFKNHQQKIVENSNWTSGNLDSVRSHSLPKFRDLDLQSYIQKAIWT